MARRKFSEAEQIVRTIPPGSDEGKAIRLALANYYYAAREVDKARSLYDEYFSQYDRPPTNETVLRFYTEAALVLAQMLETSEQFEAAATNLDRVLAITVDGERKRELQAKQVALYLRAVEAGQGRKASLISTARALAEDIQYGGPFWVARSLVLLAEADRAEGKASAALKRLDDGLPLFKQIDDSLKDAGARDQSPKAGYHFVRGRIYEAEAMKAATLAQGRDAAAQATARKGLGRPLNEYARIMKYYGESDFSAQATLRAREIEDAIIALGGSVKRLTPD